MDKIPKAFGLLGAAIPLGIGLTALGFLWGTPFNQFGSPPLFFRVFASFIAFAFVLTGASAIYGILTGMDPKQLEELSARYRKMRPSRDDLSPRSSGKYICQHCGAPLEGDSDVSPHGDVKCTHCGKWFNIHSA